MTGCGSEGMATIKVTGMMSQKTPYSATVGHNRQSSAAKIMQKQLVQINIWLKSVLFILPLPFSTLEKQPGLLAEALQHLITQIPPTLSLRQNKQIQLKLMSSCLPLTEWIEVEDE